MTTTLLTFLVRAPLGTRSVNLLGSWDNFTTSYAMQRDTRTGPEHWSGCHTFSNIICDGNLNTTSQSREGGLKMGGTYWYYYKLDNDVEFHNVAEPSTTSCPMLPGQMVNVLHVPIALSGARTRSASTSSELRTLNPSDKYLNPRPVPRPTLHRIQTSPIPPVQPWTSDLEPDPVSACSIAERADSSGQDATPSTSNNSFRLFRLPRKVPGSSSRSDSPTMFKSTGFRNPFRVFTKSPRSTSPDSIREDLKSSSGRHLGSEDQPLLLDDSSDGATDIRGRTAPPLDVVSNFSSELDLALQRLMGQVPDSSEGFATMSFHRHRGRRSRSRSGDPTPIRTSLGPDAQPTGTEAQILETLTEVQSALPTPACTGLTLQIPPPVKVDLEKRLPTLPNTPSSAYPPSPIEERPDFLGFIDVPIRSHFSASTVASDVRSPILDGVNTSHFSAWTDDGASIAILASRQGSFSHDMTSPTYSTFSVEDRVEKDQAVMSENNDTVQTVRSTDSDAQIILSTSFNDSLPDSVTSRSPASSVYDMTDSMLARPGDKKREGKSSWTSFEHYRLPADEYISEITLKQFNPHDSSHNLFHDEAVQERQVTSSNHHSTHISHSDSMQELLDELSYLTEVIHH